MDTGPFSDKKLKLPSAETYEVGFAKPPLATQFKPGQSGNPKGRPRGKKRNPQNGREHERLKTIILEEAYRTIKVNDGDKQIPIPMAQAVMRSLAVTAAKGNTRAQKLFAELLARTELSNKQVQDEWLQTTIEYKAHWEAELERRKHFGIKLADPLPHPDDVFVDFGKNTVTIQGPMDKREQADLDNWLTRKNDTEAELQALRADKNDLEYASYVDQLDQEITHTNRILEIINSALAMRGSPNCIQRRLSQLNLKTPDYLLKLKEMAHPD